jgi:hypothetical protein
MGSGVLHTTAQADIKRVSLAVCLQLARGELLNPLLDFRCFSLELLSVEFELIHLFLLAEKSAAHRLSARAGTINVATRYILGL